MRTPTSWLSGLLLAGLLPQLGAYPSQLFDKCSKATSLTTATPDTIMGQSPTATSDVFDAGAPASEYTPGEAYTLGLANAYTGRYYAVVVTAGSYTANAATDTACGEVIHDGSTGAVTWSAPNAGAVTIAIAAAGYYGDNVVWERRELGAASLPTAAPTASPETESPVISKVESSIPFDPPGSASGQNLQCILLERADGSRSGSGCTLVNNYD